MAAPKAPPKKKGSMPPWMQKGGANDEMPGKPMPAKKKAPAKKGK